MVVRNKGIKSSAQQIKTNFENKTFTCTLCFVNICEIVSLSKQELHSLPVLQPSLLNLPDPLLHFIVVHRLNSNSILNDQSTAIPWNTKVI